MPKRWRTIDGGLTFGEAKELADLIKKDGIPAKISYTKISYTKGRGDDFTIYWSTLVLCEKEEIE